VRVYYVSPYNPREPRRTTNRISDVRFCRGLARGGAALTFIAPYFYRSDNIPAAEIRAHHGITEPLEVKTLRTPLWDGSPRWLRVPVWFCAAVAAYLAEAARPGGRLRDSVWISRDHNAILAFLLLNRLFGRRGGTIVYWAHELLPEHRPINWIYRNADGVLTTNSAIAEDLERDYGVRPERTAVTLHSLDPEMFADRLSRTAARRHLGIENGRPLVVYTGKLGYQITEPQYIIEAARLLPDCSFVLTGGTPDRAEHWQRRAGKLGAGNVRFTGYLDDPADVRRFQIAADVLVSYYTTDRKLLDYNFPQKIAEYMLSGTPIVTLDARATRDVLNPHNAVFVEPHSAPSLAAGIRSVLESEDRERQRAERAYRDAQAFTLEARGRETLSFIARLRQSAVAD
jgi:glycosyltransferase involved in cell wall biosynthesis